MCILMPDLLCRALSNRIQFPKRYTSTFHQHGVHSNDFYISDEFLEPGTLQSLRTKNWLHNN
jgi:hypothetical protein